MSATPQSEIRWPLHGVIFAVFIAGKLVGGYMATWSWWWLLMPLVPVIGAVLHGFAQ